ncbi:MAG: single-stranded-DNA-specific exonuclease RecJ [Candidatus Omnitrophota bacterium]
MHAAKKLNLLTANAHVQAILCKEMGISRVLAQLLVNRGISSCHEAEKFLNIKLSDLRDPYSFGDMRRAVEIIRQAAKNKDKTMVFGDYDVDGITSVALLKNTLAKIGINALHYIPHRIKEGYGLTKNILHTAKEKGVKLLITADCGTSGIQQVGELRNAGIEVIITDHHEPSGVHLPPASAMINPKIKDCSYGFRELAGVGVAYKLCQALSGSDLIDDLDIVSLGTIADVVPLKDENRVIAKFGLARLSGTRRPGLKALIETSRMRNKKMNSTFVAYILGPRINASGRMDTSDAALRLLTTLEENEAGELAKFLEKLNRDRQKIEAEILGEAFSLIEKEVNFKDHKIIVVAGEGWHQGVLGIVASKVADKFYRPTIVISLSDGLCKGSGRSIKNFHLFEALLECRELLNNFGGHSHAVGLNIHRDKLHGFKQKINDFAKETLKLEDLLPSMEIDMELALSDLTDEMVAELEMLEPFGTGNAQPLFISRNLTLKGIPQILGKDTIKFWVSDGSHTYQAIGFGKAALRESMVNSASFDLVYTPRFDTWQDSTSILLEVEDIFCRG